MQRANELSISQKILASTDLIVDNPSEEIRKQLVTYINELINVDFNSLVQLLYRIDVDEKKLKIVLHQGSGADAASLIADIIIKRQLQKIETKRNFSNKEKPAGDDSW